MLQNKVGYDIIQKIGGIETIDKAQDVFREHMDADNLANIRKISNTEALIKIANAIVVCRPDDVFVNTGSDEHVQKVRRISLEKGEEAELAMVDHTIHFDLAAEQGRIIDRTFYIANSDEQISSLANRMDRDEALEVVRDTMSGIMKDKTMIIGFYSRGPIGFPGSNPAIEVTSSLYVSHSAELLYRNVFDHFDEEVGRLGHFYANIHSEGLNRTEDLPNARVFMDRSFQTTYSMNCTYAGNTLLLKKGNHRFSVDRSVRTNRGFDLAEHMFITGIEGPDKKRVTWFAGAAPSGCGKTTTAMADAHFLGDDLAQMWIADDGTVRSINPESGSPSTSLELNPFGFFLEDGNPVCLFRIFFGFPFCSAFEILFGWIVFLQSP